MGTRLVVIGGDAAGMSAAAQARRRRSDFEVIALERSDWTSYAACGIPYVIAGDVESIDKLVVRTPQQFRDQLIDIRIRHEAKAIDLDRREVEVRNLDHNRTFRLGFDQLVIATGGKPMRPPIPGADLPIVHGVQTLGDAAHLLEHATALRVSRVVIIGGGYIGLEMSEAFLRRGMRVVLVDSASVVMSTFDPEMGERLQRALTKLGVSVHTDVKVTAIEPDAVHTSAGSFPCDLVVSAIGVAPNSALAAEAGIALGVKDAVAVDRKQATNVAGIWSAGDCAESTNVVTGRQVHYALGTIANKQGRVAGINASGGYAASAPVAGTAISKVCDYEAARTGLNAVEAAGAGFRFVTATIDANTRASYFPGTAPMTVRMLAERRTGRLLGAQIVGGAGAAKRIDVVATALTARLDVYEVADLDLGYAPPFSPVWDPIAVAARAVSKEVDASR